MEPKRDSFLRRKTTKFFKLHSQPLRPKQAALKIALIYAACGLLWILFSDTVTNLFISKPETLTFVSMIKGWIYVLITGIIIYLLTSAALEEARQAEIRRIRSYTELENVYARLAESEHELRKRLQSLEESQKKYRLVSEATNDGIWEQTGDQVSFSDRWYAITGYEPGEIQTIQQWISLIHPNDKNNVIRIRKEAAAMQKDAFDYEYRLRKKNGQYIWIWSRARTWYDKYGKLQRILGTHTDITALREYQSQLHHQAYFDSLTNLPNRLSLNRDLEEYIVVTGHPIAALFIDLDNFKNVNDFMSHNLGDQLLQQVSRRIEALLDEGCSLYRFGGDEFILLYRQWKSLDSLEEYAIQILESFKAPFALNDSLVYITPSIGIAVYPDHASDGDELIKHSDIAMYRSKDKGGNCCTVFDPTMIQDVSDRLKIEGRLRTALANNELTVFYQPEVAVQTNQITGFEALLRWNSPGLEEIPVQRVIEIAETTGLIVPIGRWVLEQACRFIKQVHELGYKDLSISVNVSIVQLTRSQFAQTVSQILQDVGLDAAHLRLEITESVLMESYEIIRSELEALNEIGISMALDDFGKGYSSLAYLKFLPITTLKIDKSFIDDIVKEQKDRLLTDQIIAIGEKLGLSVVAEGVEMDEQLEYLVHHRCDKYQGFIFSRPVCQEQAISLLHS